MDEKPVPAAEVEQVLNAMLDELADIEHQRWAHWQRYMFSKCQKLPNGDMVVPAEYAAKWQRQVDTPFQSLSADEKESDRDQVRRYLPTIIKRLIQP